MLSLLGDVFHAQQLNRTIIVRFRGSDHEEVSSGDDSCGSHRYGRGCAGSRPDALIARAKSFELDTPYVPPPAIP
jgi:hypothetical protein